MLSPFLSMNIQRSLFTFFGSLLFLATPFAAYAEAVAGGATLSISPVSGTFNVGKTFTATVVVDSTQGFNSANARVQQCDHR